MIWYRSSHNYLKRFSIHYVAIDKSFVRDVRIDQESEVIDRAIVETAKNLCPVLVLRASKRRSSATAR
jgi:EAL domain-containing protein (putative c-di-GMP-specific phosphodiesterase class I)